MAISHSEVDRALLPASEPAPSRSSGSTGKTRRRRSSARPRPAVGAGLGSALGSPDYHPRADAAGTPTCSPWPWRRTRFPGCGGCSATCTMTRRRRRVVRARRRAVGLDARRPDRRRVGAARWDWRGPATTGRTAVRRQRMGRGPAAAGAAHRAMLPAERPDRPRHRARRGAGPLPVELDEIVGFAQCAAGARGAPCPVSRWSWPGPRVPAGRCSPRRSREARQAPGVRRCGHAGGASRSPDRRAVRELRQARLTR